MGRKFKEIAHPDPGTLEIIEKMSSARVYFDWNASAPLLLEAREAMIAALDAANPSSVHTEGRSARRLIEEARASVAALVNAKRDHIIFTSGATEAASILLTPDWRMGRSPLRMSRLLVCEADHPCLRSGGRFAEGDVTRLGVDRNGQLRLDELEAALAGHDKEDGIPLVAVHFANNETGVVQPVEAIGQIVKRHGGVLVLDAVQAGGRIELDIANLSCDFLILSAHKIGGPKGIGAIVAKADLMMPAPLIVGGGQEKGFRAGTENSAGIAGFGAAARSASKTLQQIGRVRQGRDALEKIIFAAAPDAEIYGDASSRLANTTFFSIPGMKAETLQIALDLAGFAVSAGSACSSGKVGPSHVLTAMGYDAGDGAIRLSIGASTTGVEIERFGAALSAIVARRKSPGAVPASRTA